MQLNDTGDVSVSSRRGLRLNFKVAGGLLLLCCLGAGALACSLPAIGAGALLFPHRRTALSPLPAGCEDTRFAGDGVTLRGWRCHAVGERRGILVYLHGVADNRSSGSGVITRFAEQGFEAVAYDSRAHGQSDGKYCTYGYFEKEDLRRVLDALPPGPVVLIGHSLGAAVALQHAAQDGRVKVVVAAESFADLRSVATERAPFVFSTSSIGAAIKRAEQDASFVADTVSPVEAARMIRVPTLIIHGENDDATSPQHSRRIHAALPGPKRLILVPGARHAESLRGHVWAEIEQWIAAGWREPA